MEHQEPLQALSKLASLQGFRVMDVSIEMRSNGLRVRIIRLQDDRRWHQCPVCGRRREGLFQEEAERRWRDRSLGDFETYLAITPWRIRCCGGTRVESFSWEAEGHRMTRRFFELVAALTRRLSIYEVARMCRLSWETVCRIDKESIETSLGDLRARLRRLRWIGIDEVSRTGGHVYFAIVTNLKTGEVVWIGEGKGEETALEFFRELGPKRCRRIRAVVSDLSAAYIAAIEACVPHARHLLDRFHITQWVNQALEKVRRVVFGGAPRDEIGRGLKKRRWVLLTAWEKLTLSTKRQLHQLLAQNHELQLAYLLKEQLRGIFHYPWIYLGALRRNLRSWCRMAMDSGLGPFVRIGQRLLAHLEKVVESFHLPVSMGRIKAVNGKINFLRRQARGYRDPEYFKLKIYQRCSKHLDPYASIVL